MNGLETREGSPSDCPLCSVYQKALEQILAIDIEAANTYTIERLDYIRVIELMRKIAKGALNK